MSVLVYKVLDRLQSAAEFFHLITDGFIAIHRIVDMVLKPQYVEERDYLLCVWHLVLWLTGALGPGGLDFSELVRGRRGPIGVLLGAHGEPPKLKAGYWGRQSTNLDIFLRGSR